MLRIDARGKRVLLISDLHFPWAINGWFEFLSWLHERRKYDLIISMGDEVDGHGISFHEDEQGMPTASKELEQAQDCMKLLSTLFPKVHVLESNHGSLIFRRAKFHKIPYAYLKPLPDLYGTPLYTWHEEIILDTLNGPVYLCHGRAAPYGKLAKEERMSAVQGHFHSKAEITWHRSRSGQIFNMFVGCLADQEKLAFTYSRNQSGRFQNCVGELDRSGLPQLRFVPKKFL
jgi:predicted MPP superfamily phosphohydrolase